MNLIAMVWQQARRFEDVHGHPPNALYLGREEHFKMCVEHPAHIDLKKIKDGEWDESFCGYRVFKVMEHTHFNLVKLEQT